VGGTRIRGVGLGRRGRGLQLRVVGGGAGSIGRGCEVVIRVLVVLGKVKHSLRVLFFVVLSGVL
jgi:hypothetical protein